MADIVNSQTRSRMMAGIRGKDTKPELALRRALHVLGFRYRLHVKGVPGKPDIVMSKYNAVIFVHGCFWHRHRGCRYTTSPSTRRDFWTAKFDANVARDVAVRSALSLAGWRVATVWECALRTEAGLAAARDIVSAWLHDGGSEIEVCEADVGTSGPERQKGIFRTALKLPRHWHEPSSAAETAMDLLGHLHFPQGRTFGIAAVTSTSRNIPLAARPSRSQSIANHQSTYTKQRRIHRVPISHEAVALIRLRREIVPKGCPFLFPGDVPDQPVGGPKRFWPKMQKVAQIPDVRIHDLRHTFASLLVSGGASLEMIGRLLGHTQIGTTQRYAHLIDAPLRAGVNAVGEMLKPRLRVVGE